ncbi:MAG: hypothetical protein AB7F36_07315 [Reyranellaceae bacterium]
MASLPRPSQIWDFPVPTQFEALRRQAASENADPQQRNPLWGIDDH